MFYATDNVTLFSTREYVDHKQHHNLHNLDGNFHVYISCTHGDVNHVRNYDLD